MIPAKQKVSHGLFEVLMKQGRSFHSELFSLKVLFQNSATPAKFSVVVSKKIDAKAKSAVWRNSIKRRIYGLLDPLLPLAKPGVLCAVFVKKKVEKDALPTFKTEIKSVLKKAGVIGAEA